jgi:predicted DNA-binding transcriptional regulator AlpA
MTKRKLLISANELAKMLDVSSRTVWRMNATEMLPQPVKLNRSVRWVLSEVADWIEQGCPTRREYESSKQSELR